MQFCIHTVPCGRGVNEEPQNNLRSCAGKKDASERTPPFIMPFLAGNVNKTGDMKRILYYEQEKNNTLTFFVRFGKIVNRNFKNNTLKGVKMNINSLG